jgi:hypothetical protein
VDYFLGVSAFLSSAFAGTLLVASTFASALGATFFSSFLAGVAAAGAGVLAAGAGAAGVAGALAGSAANAEAATRVAIRVATFFISKFPLSLGFL